MSKKSVFTKKELQRIYLARHGKVSDEEYPIEDWRYDVSNGDTRLGYADWVEHNIESHKGE